MKINLFKGSIKRKLRVLIAFGVIVFIGISLVTMLSFYNIRRNVLEHSHVMSDSAAEFTEKFLISRINAVLEYDASEKARMVERELFGINTDLKLMADMADFILEHPENYKPRYTQTYLKGKVDKGVTYILPSPELKTKGISPSVQQEIDLMGNLDDTMIAISHHYKNFDASCYFVSDKGYMLYLYCDDDIEINEKNDDEINFDPRTRNWYIATKKSKKGETVLSDTYLDNESRRAITIAAPCYIQDEFVGIVGIGYSLNTLYSHIMKKTLGESYINFAVNKRGEIIFSSHEEGELCLSNKKEVLDLRNSSNKSLSDAIKQMMTGNRGTTTVTVNNKEYYLSYAPVPTPGWYFGTLITKEEVLEPAQVAKTIILEQSGDFVDNIQFLFWENIAKIVFLFIVIIAISILISRKATEQLIIPLITLADGIKEIARGNLDKKLEIKTDDELEYLANCINDMTTELKTYMENLSKAVADEERISTELELARDIQEGSLPHNFPKHDKVDIYASMTAAKKVGGDFYDFYRLGENHLAVTIADVSGKGVPAALFMMRSKTILKNLTFMSRNFEDVASILNMANSELYENNGEMMFVTVWIGILDLRNGELTYANGGHDMPLVGSVENSDPNWHYVTQEKVNHMVGIDPNYKFAVHRLTLKPGDMLFLYTDGVTEAMNEKGELYSDVRLKHILNQECKGSLTAKEILTIVGNDIETYVEGAEQSDDITMLGLKYLG
ncbi:MAG: SpoIIE family protein phosphatase [Selenomonadaceae bacterium]|nr:SpoIIE family protein phosphatase [Selenomonadaceae bacterium]